MEDAMIINKASLERGFGSGCIYKCEVSGFSQFSLYFIDFKRVKPCNKLELLLKMRFSFII